MGWVRSTLAVNAAAIILTVEMMLPRKFDGAEISAPFFEVGGKVTYPEFPFEGKADLVDLFRIFERGNGKGGAEKVIPARLGLLGRATKSQLKAAGTARSPLGFTLIAADGFLEKFGGVVAVEKIGKPRLAEKAHFLGLALLVFLGAIEIGVEIKDVNAKDGGELFEAI